MVSQIFTPANNFQQNRIVKRSNLRLVICAQSNSNEIFAQTKVKKKLSVFVSGGGSNFKQIYQNCKEGIINGSVEVVVSDAPQCGGVEFAQQEGIPVIVFPQSKKAPQGISSQELLHQLKKQFEIDYILLAGFLKLIPQQVVGSYHRAILNIHPGLLPAFGGKGYYGQKVHQAVISSGARYSGASIHFVDENYDTGPIIAQEIVPVLPFDTPKQLAQRVLVKEHELYSRVVAALCDDRVTWRDDGIPIIWEPK